MKFQSAVNVIALAAKVATGIIPSTYLQILSQSSIDIFQKKLDKLPYAFPQVKDIIGIDDDFVKQNILDILHNANFNVISFADFDHNIEKMIAALVNRSLPSKDTFSDDEINRISIGLKKYLLAVDNWAVGQPSILRDYLYKLGVKNIETSSIIEWHTKKVATLAQRVDKIEIQLSPQNNIMEIIDIEKGNVHPLFRDILTKLSYNDVCILQMIYYPWTKPGIFYDISREEVSLSIDVLHTVGLIRFDSESYSKYFKKKKRKHDRPFFISIEHWDAESANMKHITFDVNFSREGVVVRPFIEIQLHDMTKPISLYEAESFECHFKLTPLGMQFCYCCMKTHWAWGNPRYSEELNW